MSRLEAAVACDFEPCGRDTYKCKFADWHRFKDFQHFVMKLQTSGYVVVTTDGVIANRKTVRPDSLVSRGRNARHCLPKKGVVFNFLEHYKINLLDQLASL